MSDEEGFLARWSRRKRSAGPGTGDAAEAPRAPRDEPPAQAEAEPEGEAVPPVEPAELPPVESIGPASDVRGFLEPHVPAELTRTALRRAWSADPAIRDFIGLQENAWDFNAPGGESGFGLISADDARRLLARMTEPVETPTEEHDSAEAPPATAAKDAEMEESLKNSEQVQSIGESMQDDAPPPERGTKDAAMQQKSREREYTPVVVRRRHGGAAPE